MGEDYYPEKILFKISTYLSKSVHWQTMRLHLYSISDSFEEFIDVAVEFETVGVVFSRGTVDIAWSKR